MDLFNKKKLEEQRKDIQTLSNMVQSKEDDYERLEKLTASRISYLEEENKKLIEWVYKIIEEAGVYEVPERNSVKIPICKRTEMNFSAFEAPVFTKEIEIPSITIKKCEVIR